MTITPSNGGILLEISGAPASTDADDNARPRVGYVIRVGGGVPWLKPKQAVVYNPRRATQFFWNEALVDQQEILAVLDGVVRTCSCGNNARCSDCPRFEGFDELRSA